MTRFSASEASPESERTPADHRDFRDSRSTGTPRPPSRAAVLLRLLPGDADRFECRSNPSGGASADIDALQRDLARTRSDLQLLLRIAQPAVILLDGTLRARWFTPEVRAFVDDWDRSSETLLEAVTRSCDCDDLLDVARRARTEETAMELESATADGRILRFRLLPYDEEDPARQGLVLGIREVTRFRRLEKQIAEISETERRRIGEDLHDMIASRLTAVSMRLQNLHYSLVEEDRAVTEEDLEGLIEEVRRGADEARTLSHALVPVPLYESCLSGALGRLAKEIDKLHPPRCIFEGDRAEDLPEETTTGLHLYRIAYEAVQNAVQHADPETIRIRLERTDGTLDLTVADDGTGFPQDTDTGDDDQAEQGLGLHLMRYRADLIGARLHLEQRPSGGTILRCSWPIQSELPTLSPGFSS